MEKHQANRKHLHMVFIDLEKAYNKIPRDLVWWVFNKRNISRGYIEIIKSIYEGTITSVRTTC